MAEVIDSFTGNYACLSNFWVHRVCGEPPYDVTVEHGYQAAKTADPVLRRNILQAATPGIAKRMGRQVTLRPDWEQIKVPIMSELVAEKFFSNKEAADILRGTGRVQLIERNHWHDNFFGSCTCSRCGDEGRNALGTILMSVRACLDEC